MNFSLKYFFLLISLMNVWTARAQLGDPVFIQNFGKGDADPNTIGPPLPAGATDFTYSKELCPPPGSYTIVRRMNIKGCPEWIPLSKDDGNIDFGMMMLVNNNTSSNNRIVYVDTTNKSFCKGTIYNFSFAVINVDSPSHCDYGPDFPVFEFRLEDGFGNLIKKDTTRPGVNYALQTDPYRFSKYGFDFSIPAGVNTLVTKLTLLHSTYLCAEDFAIDDIAIAPRGPQVKIEFANLLENTIVKSVCFKDNKTISMSGSMGAYYTNPSLQWQQSIDSGLTWTDIPGATSNNYARPFSTPDTFLFRLTGGDAATIANPNCRVVSNIIKVEVDGVPTNIKVTNNSPLCTGQDLQFNAEGGATYIWSGPNGFYDNIPFPHVYKSVLADSGTYYVQITSLGGCTTTDSTHVIMIGTDVYAGPDTSICNGNLVTLHASAGTSYLWSPSDVLSNSAVQNPKTAPTVTTTYTVKVTTSDGCSDTANVTVKVLNNTAVKALFSSTEYLCRPVDTASFQDMSVGKIKSWNWNFGNGKTSNEQQPPPQLYYISENKSNYFVSLKVTDTTGCTDSSYRLVKVADNCYIAVPSAFTPNADGRNDYLYPLNAYKATNLIFKVFNRYGQLIFETKDWTKKWDGTFGGNPQPAGVYIWMLDYNDESNKRISLRGTTVLIR